MSRSEEAASPRRGGGAILRLILAGLLVAWGSLSLIPNPVRATDSFCSTVTTTATDAGNPAASVETVVSCNPADLTALIPYIFGALLLLWPEISEIEIPGLLSLKRRVEEQGEQLEQQALRQDILSQAILLNQNNMSQELHIHDLQRSISAKGQLLEGDDASTGEVVTTDERDRLLGELRDHARELSDLYEQSSSTEEMPEQGRRRLVKWSQVFRSEIQQLVGDVSRVQENPYGFDLEYLRGLNSAVLRLVNAAKIQRPPVANE